MIRPRDTADLAEALRGATGPLRVQGGGTRRADPPGEATVLSMSGIAGILDHEPGALTLVARAGTPLAAVEAALAAENQRLAFEPMDHRAILGTSGEPTLGGVVAANVSGPRRVQAGACRDFLLGLEFVDGTGMTVRAGGRVMKNVTGIDLTRLLAGSRGRLGIVTEVALKVLPLPETAAMLTLQGLDVAQAVAAMAAALTSPCEVTGAAHDPESRVTRFRIEGFAGSVAYRAGRLAEILRPWGPAAISRDAAAIARTWAAIRDVTDLAGRDGDLWRLSLRASEAPGVLARAGFLAARLDWGGGLIWGLAPGGTDLRARIGRMSGHATLLRAAPATFARIPAWPPEAPAVAALSAGLRARFDPRGILGPGAGGH